MSKMSELVIGIMEAAADLGDPTGFESVTVETLAKQFNVSEEFILDALEYNIDVSGDEDYDDSMDGDFDSAMASAGFGTDEDYGYFGGEDY